MRIRASLFDQAAICPAVLDLDRTRASGNTYTGQGTLGHKWLEAMILGQQPPAVDVTFRRQLLECWGWLQGEGVIPLIGGETEQVLELQIPETDIILTGHCDYRVRTGDEAVVVDWKFYNDPSRLPPMLADRQMLSYGVMNALQLGLSKVTVRRVLCYYCRMDTMVLTAELLDLAVQALKEDALWIQEREGQAIVGAHCATCLQAQRCGTYIQEGRHIGTEELAPYTGGELVEMEAVRRFLLAVPVIEARLQEGREAAKAWVRDHGRIQDPVSGKSWGPNPQGRDSIDDDVGCLRELAKLVGSEAALDAASTTKGGMEAALKAQGLKPAERGAFFDALRRADKMHKKEVEMWAWKK